MRKGHLRSTLVLFHLFLVAPLTTCTQTVGYAVEEDAIPVPDAAYNIERYSLKSESASQADFKIDAEYPNTGAASFYIDLFRRKGWLVCDGNDEWIDYDKRVTNESTSVPTRQKLIYLASEKEEKLLLVALRYFGIQETNSEEPRKWNDETQHVTVIIYDLRGKGFDKTLSILSLRCGF